MAATRGRPAGLAEARRRLLRQTADAWSADDQAAVGDFLQARIAEVRARDDTGTWLEHLTDALDYRAWNRFVIQRHQNGQWRPATGPASGGERVLAASVPLFAAASSHYASAGNPHAPRLVTLDEAFAGVDDNARAKYLGLLAAFDLDVVMTSEREWGCYPEVPGLAISQLARTEDVAAVLVTQLGVGRRPVVPGPRRPRHPAGSRGTERALPRTGCGSDLTEQRLIRLLGGDDLGWLLARIRRRLERGESLDTSVTLAAATPEQRAAVHRLLGRPPRPGRDAHGVVARDRRGRTPLRSVHRTACPRPWSRSQARSWTGRWPLPSWTARGELPSRR